MFPGHLTFINSLILFSPFPRLVLWLPVAFSLLDKDVYYPPWTVGAPQLRPKCHEADQHFRTYHRPTLNNDKDAHFMT